MGEQSKIQWTDATINFWHGCKKVSPGCKYCYMYRDKEKYGQDGNNIVKTSKKTIEGIYKKLSSPSLIFTCSWSDFFLEEADEWRNEAWFYIRSHPQHVHQILTKRPENILSRLPYDWDDHYYGNVWLGVSVENDDYSYRIAYLEEIKKHFPNIKVFASFEPLIGEICYHSSFECLDWIIIGGESGNDTGKYRYRKCELDWIEDITSAFQFMNKPIFVKQLGTHLAKELKLKNRMGGDINEFPKHLQIREFPTIKG